MVTEGDRGKKKAKKSFSQSRSRARVISEWRGAVDPPDPERNLSNASDWVERLLKKAGLADGVEIQAIRASWREITDEFIAANTEPVSLKNGVLSLRVVQPSMRHHLMQSRLQLKKNLQEKLGNTVIKDLRIQLG